MKLLKSIFSRWVIISLLILIQIALFCGITFFFYSQYLYFIIVCEILSILALLGLLAKVDENPNHKIPWIIIILLAPPAGLVIYMLFGKGYISKKHSRLYQSAKDRQDKFINQDNKIIEEISKINEKYKGQCLYINKTSNTPVYKNTKVTYLKTGEEYFESLINDLKNAKHFIFLEYFILGEGKLLNEVLEILTQKVQEGVDVRVIYDDIGSIKVLPYKFDDELKRKGIKCIKFNKYYPIVSVVFNNRDHRKIAVIDGYIGYTGGLNIADEYVNYIKKCGYWKDNGIRLYGEAVLNLTLMFLKTYDIYSNEKTNYENYLPHTYHKDEFESDGYIQPFGDGPAPIYENYIGENVYLNMINQATKYVYITTPYLIVDNLLMNALEQAAKRGVDVKIITPGIPDKKMVYSVTRDSYGPLIKAGVQIYEYEPGFIHAKTIIVDDETCVIGTINFDYRSLVHHFECACFIIKSSSINDVKKDFNDILKQSRIPSKKVYSLKNIIKRIYLSIIKFFAPFM